MGLTGVIYGGIVALWLCYLVPLALRRYDEAARTRSVDRFSSRMRVLSMAEEPLVRHRTLGGAADSRRATRPVLSLPARRAARVAAARRRRVLGLLVVGMLGVAVAVVLESLPVWSVAVPAALVMAFLIIARLQVSKARTASWESVLRSAATTASAARLEPVGDEPDEAPTVVLDAVLEQQQVVAAPVETVDGRSLWDPVPITVPTYVSKPRAERPFRTIDLSGEGVYSSGRLPESEAEEAALDTAAAASTSVDEVPVRAVGD